MRLSRLLSEMGIEQYQIENECEFDFLALSSAELQKPFCSFIDSEKHIDSLPPYAVMVLTLPALAPQISGKNRGVCIVENPRMLFFLMHNYLSENANYVRPLCRTTIGIGCQISPLASIAMNNVTIGDNVTIEEFAVIRENTSIGSGSIIRAGTIIGGQGFEFKHAGNGMLAVAHVGGVSIGKNVELQCNICVDKGIYPWDDTVIGDNTKIDNLVHVAHGVKIDPNVLIVASTFIGGRVHIKENSWIGAGATVINGITIGKNARVNIGAVATKSVENDGAVTGNFAIEHDKFIRNLKALNACECLGEHSGI